MAQLKLPNGVLGLIVSSTNEAQQEDLFFPCDPRLFAVNVNGDPECGSLVFDLNKANEPDSARGAYLQSAFRVVKLPLGQPNAIAFQLDLTGKKDTQGGFFCEIMQAPAMNMPPPPGQSGGPGGPGATVVAVPGQQAPPEGGFGFGEGSHNYGGPFHVGVVGDKHFHGEDADGNPINALHLWTSANFFMNRIADGPLRFELEYKEGEERDFVVPCHLAWTGADWAIWTTTDFYRPPAEPDLLKPRPLPKKEEQLPPGIPQLVEPARGIIRPLEDPLRTAIIQPPGGVAPIDLAEPSIDGRVSGSGAAMNMVATLSGIMAPAMVFRPENYSLAALSGGLFDAGQDGSRSSTQKNRGKVDSSSPVTMMASGFGAQGGSIDSGGSGGSTNTGAEGDPWVYNQIPPGTKETGRTTSKYPGGTASGGIIYHPPETDLRDLADYGMVPPNVTLSEVLVVVAPNASFAAGIPDLANGAMKTGYSWTGDSTTGDLVFSSNASTTKTEAVRFTNPGQEIRWYSGQSFWGQFAHVNTANRTWDFPDASGTFALGSGAANRVAYWSSANALTGDADFTFNATTNFLTVDGLNLADTSNQLVFQSAGVTGTFTWTPATSNKTVTLQNLSGYMPLQNDSALTAGSVLFADSNGLIEQDNTNFFFDETNSRLGLGPGTATSPERPFHIFGSATVRPEFQLTNAASPAKSWHFSVVGSSATDTNADFSITETGVAVQFKILAGGEVEVTQFLNVGTPTDAAAQGDFAAGLTGASRLFWDQSAALLSLYNSTTATNLYASGGFLGINTSGPDRRLDVLDGAGNPQLRLTYTDGSVYSDFQTSSGGTLLLIPSGSLAAIGSSGGSIARGLEINYNHTGSVSFLLNNSNNANANANAQCYLNVGGTSAGDPYVLFDVGGGTARWSTGIDNSNLDAWKVSNGVVPGTNDRLTIYISGELVINEPGAAVNTRIEGDSLTHFFYMDATATTENIALFAGSAPNWQSMDRGIFFGDTTGAPSGDPANGGFMYSNAGAGTWRGSSGTITAFGPAGPHCSSCGYDFWTVASRNDKWGAYLYECGMCGKVYKKGPKSVLGRLTKQQKAELLY